MRVLFDWLRPANFMPHGHCYLWRPDVLWLHVGSDTLIALSYYAIPVALAYFVRRRRAVLPYWWVPALFAMFIEGCVANWRRRDESTQQQCGACRRMPPPSVR